MTLIYGLSANPVHQAHIELVCQAVTALRARGYAPLRTLIIPVFRRNPVGARKGGLEHNYLHRLALCELAAVEMRRRGAGEVQVSRIEERLAQASGKPNYTAETLAALQARECAGEKLLLLLSSDLVAGDVPEFGRWYHVAEIIRLATLVIAPRPGYQAKQSFLNELRERGAQLVRLTEVRTPEISSTRIRARLANGEDPLQLSAEGWLPHSVAEYLEQQPSN
ncbi:MAG: hypothetical protein U9Q70_02445 [Chloroflexota bacterium]|nr:hypothetical protein [Chloroflexota bacterium]